VQGKYMPDMNSVVYGGSLIIHNHSKSIGTKKKDFTIEQLEDEQNYIQTYPEGFITGERKKLFNTFVKKPDIDNMQNLINKLLVWPRTKKKFDFTLDIEEDIKSLTDKHLFTYRTNKETDRRFTDDNQETVSPLQIMDGDFGPPYWNTYETLVKFVKKSPQQKDIIIIMSLIYYYVVSPGEPLHHFSPHHRQRPDNSQTRTLGVRVSFPSHSNNSFPLFQSTMAVFTFTDPDMRRSPMAIKQPISIFQLTPNF